MKGILPPLAARSEHGFAKAAPVVYIYAGECICSCGRGKWLCRRRDPEDPHRPPERRDRCVDGALECGPGRGRRAAAPAGARRAPLRGNFPRQSPRPRRGLPRAPARASGELAASVAHAATNRGEREPLLIDVGADHRLTDEAAWNEFYGTPYAGAWPYGMPELLKSGGGRGREDLIGVNRIAVPGCNVSAVTLGLQPGVAAGVLDPGDVVAVLANGYSGAGKATKPHLRSEER